MTPFRDTFCHEVFLLSVVFLVSDSSISLIVCDSFECREIAIEPLPGYSHSNSCVRILIIP
jgi:hypothetical protein